MADLAGDAGVVVREVARAIFRGRNVAPGFAVATKCFRITRLFVVAVRAGRDRVEGLRHLPPKFLAHGGTLVEPITFPIEARSPRCVAFGEVVSAGVAAGDECRAVLDRAVAIDAFDGSGGARFAV